MSSDNFLISALMQLLWGLPMLFLYLVGIILAMVFWRKYQGPSVLVLLACILLLMASVFHSFAIQYMIHDLNMQGMNHDRFSTMIRLVGFLSSVVHAVGYGMILA